MTTVRYDVNWTTCVTVINDDLRCLSREDRRCTVVSHKSISKYVPPAVRVCAYANFGSLVNEYMLCPSVRGLWISRVSWISPIRCTAVRDRYSVHVNRYGLYTGIHVASWRSLHWNGGIPWRPVKRVSLIFREIYYEFFPRRQLHTYHYSAITIDGIFTRVRPLITLVAWCSPATIMYLERSHLAALRKHTRRK